MSSTNPYVSPNVTPAPVKTYTRGTRRLNYGEMFSFAFASPNWPMNLLWGSLCIMVSSLIPLVPQLVLSGYLWELVEKLHRRENPPADFDVNRFGDYLTRAIWPFLASLVGTFLIFFIAIPVAVLAIIAISIAQASESPGLAAVAIIGSYLLFFALMIPVQLALLPVVLRAGLSQEIGSAFELSWIKEFVWLMWKEMLVGAFVLTIASMAIVMAGLMVLCVGVYPAAVITMFASTHFLWQLYKIFLERGGTPVKLKAPPVPVAVAAMPPKY